METFSAFGGAPATECMRMAADADAVTFDRSPRIEAGSNLTWLFAVCPVPSAGGHGDLTIGMQSWWKQIATPNARQSCYQVSMRPASPH
jgi:hypothetical protein